MEGASPPTRRARAAGRALAALAVLSLLTLAGLAWNAAPSPAAREALERTGVHELSAGRPAASTERAAPGAIGYFSDCEGAPSDPLSCGPPAARWLPGDQPLRLCTVQEGRPASLSPEAFRALVLEGATTWNAQQAAVRILFEGDCDAEPAFVSNGRNEVSWTATPFSLERGLAATFARWRVEPGAKRFIEADILVGTTQLANADPQCLRAVLVHELGHALGMGHSDAGADVMYPSLLPNDPRTCRTTPSAAEREHLQGLYGLDTLQLVGSLPPPGSPALLVVTGTGTPPDLVALLETRGCRASVLAQLEGGAWRIYIPGAPAGVNAAFPARFASGSPLYLRCAS